MRSAYRGINDPPEPAWIRELELEAGLLATVSLHEPLPARKWYVLRAAHGEMPAPSTAFIEFVGSPEARSALEAAVAVAGLGGA